MSFFYDLNNRLAKLAAKQEQQTIAESAKVESVAKSPLTQALNESKKPDANKNGIPDYAEDGIGKMEEAGYSAKAGRAGKDLGKPGKNFSKIAKSAGEKYGSKAAGERVAGAVLNKLRHPKESIEENVPTLKGHDTKYGVVVVGYNDGKPVKTFDNEADAKAFANKGIRVGGGLKQGSVRTIVAPKKKTKEDVAQEGNAFTGKLKSTPKGGKFELDGKEITDTSDLEETMTRQHFRHTADLLKNIEDPAKRKELAHHHAGIFKASNPRFDLAKFLKAANVVDEADVTGLGEEEMDEGYAEMDAWLKGREKEKGTGRYDKKKISTGTVYTRKPETFDDPETDPEATGGAPKRKGRPVGTKRAIGAKGPGVKSKLLQKGAIAEQAGKVCEYCGHSMEEELDEKAPPGEKAERMVKHIKKSLSKDGKLSAKDKAIAYATTWKAHNAGKVEEESTDKEDTKAEKAGRKVAKDIEHDEGYKGKDDNRAEKAGKKVTKDIEYDDKKDKEEKVAETTTSGSVATASSATKASKGMQFGKGVYESLDSKLENMIAEGMNVTVNMNSDAEGEAQKSITVTATGADADKLAELLKMAGLEHKQEVCPGCGSSDCGCEAEVVDENSPDWPTDTDTLDAEPNLRTYSGGLNGPKSTGQTTVPVVASQLRRQVSMEENVELERNLFKTWTNYKG